MDFFPQFPSTTDKARRGGEAQASQEEKRPERRTRAAKLKVRTGCITCKSRRVKCDENRPCCLRCTKFAVQCDGYLVLPSKPDGGHRLCKASSRPLLPYESQKKNVKVPIVLQELGNSRFQSPEEHRFFQLYVTKTATHLSGFYGPILWNQIVLQASEAKESIRHAVISIGALDMTTLSGKKAKIPKEVEEQNVFALRQYSKAINSLRQKVFSSDYDLRTALVASLLIVCFETYHGNYESANRQTKTAVRLMEASPASTSNKDGGDVEVELLRAFDRLDIQAISQTDPYSLQEHLSLLDCNAGLVAEMPERFGDVVTARHFFNLVVRQALHLGSAFWAAHAKPSTSHSSMQLLSTPRKPSLSYFDAAVPSSAEFLEESARKLKKLERWMASFRPLFEEKKKKRESKEYLSVSALRSQSLLVYIRMKNVGTMYETTYDEYLPCFQELVNMCEDLLCPVPGSRKEDEREAEGGGDGEVFVFDMQCVMPLDFVAKKCRDPVVRRKAIKLLKFKPRREAFWDSVIAARVCEWVVGIEEEGLINGVVMEGNRARNVGVWLEPGSDEVRSAKVSCTLGTGKIREVVVGW